MKKMIKILPLLTVIFALVFGSLYPQNPESVPGKASLPSVAANLQKEIVDVAQKLTNTQIALQEAQRELADVKKIATGAMEPLMDDGKTVTADHLSAIESAKEVAIDLFATPEGASLEKFHDRFDKTEKALQEARARLDKPEAPLDTTPRYDPSIRLLRNHSGRTGQSRGERGSVEANGVAREKIEDVSEDTEEEAREELEPEATEESPEDADKIEREETEEVEGDDLEEVEEIDEKEEDLEPGTEPAPVEIVGEEPEEESESAMMDILG